MVPSSLEVVSVSPVVSVEPPPLRKLYFINELVEFSLTQYIWTGCTKVELRDQIMAHATELIRQIIRKQGLHTIYPGRDESSFGDLLQTAWLQIERVLYKYRARPHCRSCFNPDRPSDSSLYNSADNEYGIKTIPEIMDLHNGLCPHCQTTLAETPVVQPRQGLYGGSTTILYRGSSKVFNMWSQISRTVILAYIKKEGRDRKNSGSYVSHLGNKHRPISDVVLRFLAEAREICKYSEDYLSVLAALEWLIHNDDKPYEGIIGKLVDKSKLSRGVVAGFVRTIKLRSFEFTDSPLNRKLDIAKNERRRISNVEFEEDS